jgi:hypothetical protein
MLGRNFLLPHQSRPALSFALRRGCPAHSVFREPGGAQTAVYNHFEYCRNVVQYACHATKPVFLQT